MNMDSATFKKFRKDFAAAVKALEDEYGIDIHMKNIRYAQDGSEFSTKLEVLNRGKGGVSVDPRLKKLQENFSRLAWQYDMEGQLGVEFNDHGATYKVIGMQAANAKRFPFVVERSDGARFKFPAARVQRALGLEVTPTDGY